MQEMQKAQVRCLGLDDPLEDEMATHSSTLARETSWTEEHYGLQSTESQSVRHNWATEHTHVCSKPCTRVCWHLFFIFIFSFVVVVLIAQSCLDSFETPWTVAYQAPLSMGFSRQKYWSGLPFPSPWHLSLMCAINVSPSSAMRVELKF